jgi:hypothetical protein
VLPKSGNYLSRTELFDHSSLNTTKWKNVEFDIFSLHNRWNKKEVMALLREDVPTFTIIPFDVLFEVESAMEREKQLLEEANKQLYDTCVVQELANENLKGAFKEFNNNIMGFVVNK